MNPSDFTSHPFDSVLKNMESEQVARNIMIILKRTGNKFRLLSWEEYQEEREKDGNFNVNEKSHFERVSGFCVAAESAMAFCPGWKS